MSSLPEPLPVDRRSVRPGFFPQELRPVEVGGQTYEFKVEPRCKVCKKGGDVIELVNTLLATGATYRDVLRQLQSVNRQYPDKHKITYSSLRTHQKRHMPFDSYAIREIQEQRAQRMNQDFIDGQQHLITPAVFAEVMMVKGFNTLVATDTTIDAYAGLHAANMLHRITKDEQGGMDAAMALQQLNKIIAAVKHIVPEEMMAEIITYLNSTDSIDEYEEAELVEDDDDDTFDFDETQDIDDRDTLEAPE